MVSSRSALLLVTSGLLACSSALLGCADPEGDFDAFTERYGQIGTTTTTTTNTGGCTVPEAGAIDGDYFMTLSAKLNPQKPFAFLVKVTTEAMGDGIGLSMNVQALQADDRATLVGDAIDVGPYEVAADGRVDIGFPELFVPDQMHQYVAIPGAANPITGSDIQASATLSGTVCDPGEFICGDVVGEAKTSFTLKLDGSTFTLQKITGDTYPVAVLNCAGEEAPLE